MTTMDDRTYSTTKKPSPRLMQQQQRRRKRRRWCQPDALAVLFSAGVLVVYSMSLVGVFLVIDVPFTRRASTRRLRASTPEYFSEVSDHSNSKEGDDEITDRVSFRIRPPRAHWPVSLRDEVDQFESIAHPVDSTKHFVVPRFWSAPLHNKELMSRSDAMRIGSCSVPDDRGSFARGADCPLHQRTIFVMIASYRDYQCRETIESIYERASHPNRIRIGVVDQVIDGVDNLCNEPRKPCYQDPDQILCKYAHLIDTVTLDARLSVGPVPARHIGYRMYRGEYYALQSDAHVSYVNRWEMSLIHELESTGNEMAVLSTYLSDVVGAMDENGESIKTHRPIMCNSYWQEWNGFYHVHHSTQPECKPAVKGTPQIHPWWSAGMSFGRGHFLVNVPYDYYQPMVFSGEEMSIAIRGWTVGYDFYTPENSVCFHHYAESKEGHAKRDNVPTFWENSETYKGSGVAGMKRLLAIVHLDRPNPAAGASTSYNHAEEDRYGLGGVRTPEHLLRILGMNVETLEMESHLCKFVTEGMMHNMTTVLLRPDGMGIDYTAFDFEWKDPAREKVNATAAEQEEGDDAKTGDDSQYNDDGSDDGTEDATVEETS